MISSLPLARKRSRFRRRHLRFEHLEVRYVLNGQAVLVDDAFNLHENGPQAELDVLANDSFDGQYTGQRLITSVSYGSEGGRIEIAGDRQSILYAPPADFFGTETFVYAVDGQYTAQVTVSLQAPLAFDHFVIPPDGLERQLDVLANDPFWPGYDGPRQITAVSVGSAGGTIDIAPDWKSIRYAPPDAAYGRETFIYIVDEIYPAQVTIEIPETLKADTFEIIQHASAQTFNVLANDPFWPAYPGARQITHVTQSALGGTVEISSDGRSIHYTPADDAIGWDSFRYVVDGAYEADVTVIIHRPVQDDWFEVDENSTGFFFNVTLNDTYYDRSGHVHDVIDRVTSVTQPESGGTVVISADGQGIVYTPPAGFSGGDAFTYLADGVHEARVTVQVSRPVRDDSISSGIYQDTPAAVLDVLANDFVGNGYDGPRLITAVGATEHGGTVAIRSDGKALLYTPAVGYTGQDRFTYTVDAVLEANVTLYVQALAQPDFVWFYADPSEVPYPIEVLENDYFNRGYSGPGIITAVELVSGSGVVSIPDGRTLQFDPAMAGSHNIRYTVDGHYQATVSVWIHPFLDPDSFVVNQNSPAQSLDVLANDFRPIHNGICYRGPRLITGVSESKHGGVVAIAADGKTVNYEPPPDFYGQDSFTYTVDDFMTATVTVEVIRRVRDDQFRVDAADGSQPLPVLVNDLLGANYSGPGQITAVTAASGGGTATIAADGHSIVYTPPAGLVGTDTFTYTVDGALKAEVSVVVDAPPSDQSPTFGSLENYTQFLIDDALVRYQYLFGQTAWFPWYPGGGPVVFDDAGPTSGVPRNHSETNVQVAGVDEGDIVEFDSDYVYMLTDEEVVIVDAWPAEGLSVASRVEIEGRPVAEFLHGDRLTVISELGGFIYPIWDDTYPTWDDTGGLIGDGFWPPWPPLPSSTIITVLDVSDRTVPTVVQTTTMEGKYVDSRGVGDFVYVLVSNPDAVGPAPQIIDEDNDPTTTGRYETRDEYLSRVTANPGEFIEAALPNYTAYGPDGALVRTGLLNTPEGIYQPLVPAATNLISVVSFNIEGDEPGLADTSAVYSTGASAIYASLDNFYVFDKDYTTEDGAVTRIVKFDWEPATGGVEFAATTTVAGTILNQFSADENGPYLRIATTVSNSQSGNWSWREENMLFVLQEDGGVFEFVGSLQNLALNETMRSVRFLGDRAFVTTFRNVDPLFAIDLSSPAHPESVGHITLPGFTSYMHLIDENHLLTVGRNTPVGASGPTQVALFDIADLSQPQWIAEYTFERFSTSEAELDHHAFGYYAEHGLLGMPVARVYVQRIDEDGDGYRETSRTVREDLLAVFSVDASAADPGDRLALAGEIEHGTPVRRSGYIGERLYSIANDSVKVVDIASPNVVIAALLVDEGSDLGDIYLTPTLNPFGQWIVPLSDQPADNPAAETAERALATAIERARSDLANRLGREAGAPLLVTAEAMPDAPGGGYCLVFRVGDQHYLYRAGDSGMVQFINGDYEFSAVAGAWHAVELAIAPPPAGMRGDYNFDGHVDQQDQAVWRAGFGEWSLTAYLPGDGNRDGIVDAADYAVWRANLGAMAGDFDRSGVVDQADLDVWRATFGSETDLRADANGDGHIDAADYVVWRNRWNSSLSASASGSDAGQSSIPQESRLTATAFQLIGTVRTERPAMRVRARDHFIRDEVLRQLTTDFAASDNDSLIALEALADEPGEPMADSGPAFRSVDGSRTPFDAVDEVFESVAPWHGSIVLNHRLR